MDKSSMSFSLLNNRTLYYSKTASRFWVDEVDNGFEPDYYDTSLASLRLEITHQCNGACSYCIVFGNEVEKFDIMDIRDTWKWLKGQDWFDGIRHIFIIGGEPMLYLDDLCFILENFLGTVSFSTNGTLMTKDAAQKLSKYPRLTVYLSTDGISEEDNSNRVYKDGKHMFPDIIKGIANAREYGLRFGFFMVASPNNINKSVEVLAELSKKYKPVRIGYSLPHWNRDCPELVTATQYRDALLSIYEHRKEIGTDIMQLEWRLRPLYEGKVKKFSCDLHTAQTTVLPDRSIVRCSKIDDHDVFGKVSNDRLNNECPISLFEQGIGECVDCVALACCGGGCPYDGLQRFGKIIDLRECIITPPLIEKAISDIVSWCNGIVDLPKGAVDLLLIEKIVKRGEM